MIFAMGTLCPVNADGRADTPNYPTMCCGLGPTRFYLRGLGRLAESNATGRAEPMFLFSKSHCCSRFGAARF